MPIRRFARFAVLAAAVCALARPARAQVGSTTDILMGRVLGPDSQPLAGALITATAVETGISRNKLTNEKGQYSIVFPDGGGQYRMTAVYVGMTPVQGALQRQADEDRLVWNVTMGQATNTLATVNVRAQRTGPGQRQEAGSSERGLPPNLIDRLPIDAGDLNQLATLAPGVVGIDGTDSTSNAFSIAGQPPDQNSITLDGLSFGSGSVPSEAIRNTRVITSTYDVGRGQFTGGQVASITRGGTANFQSAFNYSLRDPSLEFVDDPSSPFAQTYEQNLLSFGLGGPLVPNKAFLFGAFQASRRTDPLLSLLAADPVTLARLGTNADSVDRFLGIMQSYGLEPKGPDIPDDRLNDNASALTRFDWNFSEAHSLMIRGDWRASAQDATRIGPLSLPHTGGDAGTHGGGGMVSLTSHVGSFINEARAYRSDNSRNTDPYLTVPDGRVTVASTLADGTTSLSTLQFGGNPSLPQETHSTLTEASDELSWLTDDGSHRFKLGGLIDRDQSTVGVFPNRNGTFTFTSLADFEALRATTFTRTLQGRDNTAGSNSAALYLGDAWRKSGALQLTYGVRLEGSTFPDAPAYNAAVDSAFDRRTDRLPSEVHLSPRVGFTYLIRGDGGPALLTVRGGVGEFRARPPSQLAASVLNASGTATGQSQIVCVGPDVPTPDWPSYLADPTSIPTSCLGSPSPGSPVGARRNVTVFDPSYEVPRAWRASLGATRRFLQRYTLGVEGMFALGTRVNGAQDLNLNATPRFSLGQEGNRPVFVPAALIEPIGGAAPLAPSRLDTSFATVTDLISSLRSDTRQVTFTAQGFSLRGFLFNLSYTYMRSRDQALGYGFGSGGTIANPNTPAWGPSDQERRHNFIGTLTWTIKPAIELTTIARLVSGSEYTPLVNADINGDGARNDRAFIFDPAATADTSVANGMARLLRTGTPRTRSCLESQLGDVAGRNSCTSPWRPSFDLQLNLKPYGWGLERRLTVSVQAINTLAGLDQLLHGSQLHGWGQPANPDRTLLYVRGFDPGTSAYRYEVNQHFGATGGNGNAFRAPFQIALQARLTLGQDPAQMQMRAAFGGRGSRPMSEDALRERMARAIPNIFYEILLVNDSAQLQLTDDQKHQLNVKGDSLQARADTLLDSLAHILANPGKNPDPMALGARMRGRVQAGRDLATQAVKDAHAILTEEQWAKVPDKLKNPVQQRPGQGRPGGRGPPG